MNQITIMIYQGYCWIAQSGLQFNLADCIWIWIEIQYFHFSPNPISQFFFSEMEISWWIMHASNKKSRAILIYFFQKNVWMSSCELIKRFTLGIAY